ncbi:MAG: PstS family phosphate ABC transporter substrate-binding protein [Chloroflexi bacterium]|nr:PstS family phosphate ABC transporter substrate-binding protein [Chloroflexota bacterium]
MLKRLAWILSVLIVVLPMLVVLAQDTTPTPTPTIAPTPVELPDTDILSVTGDILTGGSSTVYLLTERMAERFAEEGFSGSITVDRIGTSAGFELFCQSGETDVSNASRAIRESEIEDCRQIGREPIEFRVGTDAIAVTVNDANDFVESLTLEQLADIFTGAVTTWAEVDPAWPDEPIVLYSPGVDSGTFDYFIEEVVMAAGDFEDEQTAIDAVLSAPNIQLSEDDDVLVLGVESSPYAIGYFGFAYFLGEGELLQAISLDAGDGPVTPNQETAESGAYPLARPLFIYSDADILNEKPQVAAFVTFYLSFVEREILDVGYFPASAAALNDAKRRLLEVLP